MSLDWHEYAACRGLGDEFLNMFFDDYEQDPGSRESVEAMCATCPVKDICYNWGVGTESTGVWGGRYLVRGKVKEL